MYPRKNIIAQGEKGGKFYFCKKNAFLNDVAMPCGNISRLYRNEDVEMNDDFDTLQIEFIIHICLLIHTFTLVQF